MRQYLDRLEQFAIDVILEKRYGTRASFLRGFLYGLSKLYERGVRWRWKLYARRYFRSQPVGCLVISVGNLTVGGTGKTPVVEKLARMLQAKGRRVAVLSRGYKSKAPSLRKRFFQFFSKESAPPRVVSDGRSLLLDSNRAGDEPFMLGMNLKNVPIVVDRDRVKGAFYAVKRWGVDTLILDDGFQYFPLQNQRWDVVLIDRQAPFGNRYLLPRGTLREPSDHLRRADLIFITKCQTAENVALKEEIRRCNEHAPIVECRHEPRYYQSVHTGERKPLEFIKDLRIVALSGIAAPESFENFLKQLGADLVYTKQFADHHRYSRQEILAIMKRSRTFRAKAIITTEKDAVRLPVLLEEEVSVPIYFLRVEIDVIGGQDNFQSWIDQIVR